MTRHIRPAVTRRDVLVRAAHGFGSLALASLLDPPARAADRANPLAAKPPHFPGKAKSVIFLFMVGGPSQVDTFDPKPALEKYNGQPLPASYGTIVSQFTKGDTPLLRSPWTFRKYGQCGRDVSTLFPNIAQRVDDLCFVRSFYTDSTVHAPAMYQVNTGRILMGYPEHGLVDHLRPRQREREPARLRRHAAARRHARRRHAVLGRRIPSRRLSGHRVPLRPQTHRQPAARPKA